MVAVDLRNLSIAHLYGHIWLFRFFHAADKYDQASSLCHAINITANAVVQRPSLGNKVVGLLRADDLQFLIGKRSFSRKACVGYAERPVFRSCAAAQFFGNSTDLSFMS